MYLSDLSAAKVGDPEYNCDVYGGGGIQNNIPVQGSSSIPNTDAGWVNQTGGTFGGNSAGSGFYYFPSGSNCENGGCGGSGNGGGDVDWCLAQQRNARENVSEKLNFSRARTCTPCPDYTVNAGGYCAPDFGSIPEPDFDDIATDVIAYAGGTFPNCAVAQPDAARTVWCIYSKVPSSTEKSTIQSAIAAISARGGICTTIASVLTNRLDVGALRLYPGGVASFGGVVSDVNAGTDGWLMIAREWLTTSAGAPFVQTYGAGTISRTLQQLLAHEGDHLIGNTHTDVSLGGYKTAHSGSCSDVSASLRK